MSSMSCVVRMTVTPLSRVESLDEVAERQLRHRVQAYCRLVQEEDRGLVQQRGGEVASHPLAQAELPHGHFEQRLQVHHLHNLVPHAAIAGGRNLVYIPQQLERLDYRQVPPELGPLSEDDADVANVGDALLPGNAAQYLAAAGVGHQDATEMTLTVVDLPAPLGPI